MHKDQLESCFMRLIQSLKMNQTKKNGITVFIGAGCSLSSSDKNITTYGIVEELVTKYSLNEQPSKNWRDLYEIFVNTVWNGQGTKNRIQLLEDFFQNMHPSVGYNVLRWLLENKYINQIITTNFDPMIDTVLEGLSYQLVVGEYTEIIGNDPQFTLIKAHGDLRIGQLRFAPAELAKLPEKLTESIRTITKCVVVVIGYRGQDTGILNALYDTDEYNAFWVSLEEPDKQNVHDYQQVQTWMHKRNSEGNFLYGQEFGAFDNLLEKIKKTIITLSKNDDKHKSDKISELWGQSIVFDYFRLNKRFYQLFEELNSYLIQQISKKLWKSSSPYYSSSYEKLVKTTLDLLNGNIIPISHYCIGNEVDALVFAMSCSVWLACQGYSYTNSVLLSDIRQKFEAGETDISISNEFWDMVSLLSDLDICNKREFYELSTPLSFCFDRDRDFSTLLKQIDIRNFQELFNIIEVLLLFAQTSGSEGEELYQYQSKRLLEKYLYDIKSRDGRIMLQMSMMPDDTYKNLHKSILKPFFAEHRIGERLTLYRSPVYVDFTIEHVRLNSNINVWERLVQEGNSHYQNFVNDFDIAQYINRSCFNVFSDFLQSQSSGLFIIGESGCGKTSALKLWMTKLSSVTYIVYAINGRNQDGGMNTGEKVFGEMFANENTLGYLQIMLEQRQQTLLLVIDAINEIQGSFLHIMWNYKALLNFCNNLAGKNLSNIKLVTSCRSDLYYQLIKGSGVTPSTSSFYSTVVNNEVSSVYSIPYFDNQDAETFANLYHFSETQITITSLLQEFGDMIYLPINLRMICDAYQIKGASELTVEKDVIFKTWYCSLQNLGEAEGISKEIISAVIEFTINYDYFSGNDEGLKTHFMAASLATKYVDVMAIYEWLTIHGIYSKNTYIPNRVQFSHDSLEEYFLTNYVIKYYNNKLYDLDNILTSERSSSAVLQKALLNVFFQNSYF